MSRTMSILAMWAGVASLAFAQASEQFVKANQEFAAGEFKAAIEDYESVVRAGQDAPNLFYNLGNAYFRTKDCGHPILNYDRALALDRHTRDARAPLRMA